MSADPANPFHRASFWVERLKYGPEYGPGPRLVEGVTREQIVGQYEALLRAAAVDSMTGDELADTFEHYAASLSRSFGLHPLIAKSIFVDGVMHGIAFAAGLEAPPEE